MQYHISISFHKFNIYYYFFLVFISPSFSYFACYKTHSAIQLQYLIQFHYNSHSTVQFQYRTLNHKHRPKTGKEIMKKIIFLKNLFNIKFVPYSSILLVGIGSQVTTFIYSLEQFLELNYHFFSKSKGSILDNFGFL